MTFTNCIKNDILYLSKSGLFVFLALQPTVVVFSQPGSGL